MPLKVEGLDRLQTLLQKAVPATRPRWQAEGLAMASYAQERSPVDTGLFFKSWRFQAPRTGGLDLLNNATRGSNFYAPHVHRKGDPETVLEEVRAEAQARSARLREDLAQIVSTVINRG